MYVIRNYPVYVLQIFAAMTRYISLFVFEYKAQSRKHAYAAVVGGTAANAYQERTATLLQGVDYQLTNSVGRCIQRVAFIFRYQIQTGCCGHFYDGKGAFPQVAGLIVRGNYAVYGFYRCAKRTANHHAVVRAAQPFHKGRNGTFTAVGQGKQGSMRYGTAQIPASLFQSVENGFSGLSGGQTPFEGVHGNEYVHYNLPAFLTRR